MVYNQKRLVKFGQRVVLRYCYMGVIVSPLQSQIEMILTSYRVSCRYAVGLQKTARTSQLLDAMYIHRISDLVDNSVLGLLRNIFASNSRARLFYSYQMQLLTEYYLRLELSHSVITYLTWQKTQNQLYFCQLFFIFYFKPVNVTFR